MRKNTRKSAAKAAPARQATGIDVLAELAALKAMTVPELQVKWQAIFGERAPNASRGNLELRLGYRIQELAHGGLRRETRRTLDALADEVMSGKLGGMVADPRKPAPGTKLVREGPAMLGLAVAAPGDVVGQHREVIRDDQIVFFIGPGATRHAARLEARCAFVIKGFAEPVAD